MLLLTVTCALNPLRVGRKRISTTVIIAVKSLELHTQSVIESDERRNIYPFCFTIFAGNLI